MDARAIDTIWVLLAAVLVFFMQAGFAMVESGFTRAKNVGNIIMKNVMDFSIGSLVFWVVGFSIMFDPSIGGFIGLPNFFFTADYGNDVPDMAILMFQTVFAATAATIVSGAIIIGALAGVVIVFGIELIDKVLRVDDPVGAITVHGLTGDRKSTRLNSSHVRISYAVFCLKKKKNIYTHTPREPVTLTSS